VAKNYQSAAKERRFFMIKSIKLDQAPEVKTPHGVSVCKLSETEHAQVMHINLLPGEELKRHITPVDVFFYILEGDGIVEIGEERAKVSKDMLIESQANIPHRLINDSKAAFRFLVVKTPRPTRASQVL
jgi:quercetin dioxygenase-like cupin family protein